MSTKGTASNEDKGLNQASSSKQYLQYLEEMELRIRYMKNDIEFKKSQLSNKSGIPKNHVDSAPVRTNRNSAFTKCFQIQPMCKSQPATKIQHSQQRSHQTEACIQSKKPTKATPSNCMDERIVLPLAQSRSTKTCTNTQVTQCVQKSVPPSQPRGIFSSTQDSNGNELCRHLTQADDLSQNSRTVIYSSNDLPVGSEASFLTGSSKYHPVGKKSSPGHIPTFHSPLNNAVESSLQHHFPLKSTLQHSSKISPGSVVISSSSYTAEPQSFIQYTPDVQRLPSSHARMSESHLTLHDMNPSNSETTLSAMHNNSMLPQQIPAKVVSMYKLKKVPTSQLSNDQLVKPKTPSKVVSKYKFQRLPSSKDMHMSMSMSFTKGANGLKAKRGSPMSRQSGLSPYAMQKITRSPWKLDKRTQAVKTGAVVSRFKLNKLSHQRQQQQTVGEYSHHSHSSYQQCDASSSTLHTTSSLSMRWSHPSVKTPLKPAKLQVASKLVTKYKLKRLSPTTSKHAPQFPQFYQQRFSKHKLDNRKPHLGFSGDPRGCSTKHTLDNRKSSASRPRHRRDSGVKSRHKVDRRKMRTPSKAAIPKSSSSMSSKYRWMNSGEQGRRLRKTIYTPSKFRWRRQSLLTYSSPSKSLSGSHYKWSRFPEEGNQQLKLRLRRMLHPSLQSGQTKSDVRQKGQQERCNMVMIGGILYNASSRKLRRMGKAQVDRRQPCTSGRETPKSRNSVIIRNVRMQKMKLITVKGMQFQVDAAGKKLIRIQSQADVQPSPKAGRVSRVDVGGMTFVSTTPDTLERRSNDGTRLAASRVVHRSLAIAAAKFKKDNRKSKVLKRHCMFFGRFGKCQRGAQCPFLHDPEKVAMCTRFLRGKCTKTDCPFSHQASMHKMPVCLFYLRGSCVRPECPYLHVKVNPDAPVCKDFINGYCPRGEACKKLHSFVCPSFAARGQCARGKDCSLLHRRSKQGPPQKVSSLGKTASASCGDKTSKDQSTVTNKQKLRRSLSDSELQTLHCVKPVEDIDTAGSSTRPVMVFDTPLQAQPSFISLVSPAGGVNTETHDKAPHADRGSRHGPQRRERTKTKITPSFLSWKTTLGDPDKPV